MENDQVYCNQCGTVNECQFHYCLTCGNPIGEMLYQIHEPKQQLNYDRLKFLNETEVKFNLSLDEIEKLSGSF